MTSVPRKPKRPSYKKLYKEEIQCHRETREYFQKVVAEFRDAPPTVQPTLWQRLWGA